MKKELVKTFPVLGTLFIGNYSYYAIGMVKVANADGSPVNQIGWLVTPTIPLNPDPNNHTSNRVHDVPKLVIGAPFMSNGSVKLFIDVVNPNWNDDDEEEIVYETDVNVAVELPITNDEWNHILEYVEKIGE